MAESERMTLYAEKLLPHDVEAEESVLGSLLIDGDSLTRVASMLRPEDFYRERNRLCYEAAIALSARDVSIDQVTLAGELQRSETLDAAGGMAYLSHLVSITPTSIHAEDYALVISQHSTMRRLIQAASRISELGYGGTDNVDTTIRKAEDALFAVRGTTPTKDFVPLRDIYDEYLQEQASTIDEGIFTNMPVMTGYPDLDETLGGLQKADMIILGARPSLGKTTLALNIAINAARSGQRCGDIQPGDDPPAAGHARALRGVRRRLPQAPSWRIHLRRGADDHGFHRPALRSAGLHRRHPFPDLHRDEEQGPAPVTGERAGRAGG